MLGKSATTPKYRKHSQRNLAFVEIDGRRIYLGRYGSPESEAAYHRLLLERSLAKAKAQPAPDPMAVVKAAATRSSVSIAELVLTLAELHLGNEDLKNFHDYHNSVSVWLRIYELPRVKGRRALA